MNIETTLNSAPRFDWRSLAAKMPSTPVILITGLLFFWVTGNGVLHGGMNPDDWRQIGRVPAEWGGPHGRWAMDLIYRFPFRTRYVEPLQLVLVYGCFLYIATTLARASVGERFLGVATVGIFLAGVNHPYMTDVLNFSAHIFGYPLALTLSLAAFALSPWVLRSRPLIAFAIVVGAGQLLAFSLALYPSFVLFGLILPAIALIRTDLTDDRDAIRLIVGTALIGVAGVVMFLLEWRAFQLFTHFYTARELELVERYDLGAPTLGVLSTKVLNIGVILKSVYGGDLWSLRPAHIFFQLFALLIAAVWGAAALLDLRRASTAPAKAMSLLRRTLGIVGAAVVIPILFWFTYAELVAPSRTFAEVGFVVPAILLACAASVRAGLPQAWGERALRWVGVAPALMLAIVSVFISAAMWNDQQRIAERDVALATAIYGRLSSSPDFDGKSFVLAGSIVEPRLRWGVSVGWPMTEYTSDPNMIFNNLLGYQGQVDRVARSPQRCRAFPASDSVFTYDGRTFVCLADDTGIFPLGPCEASETVANLEICRPDARRAVVKVTGDCNGQGMRTFFWRASGEQAGGTHIVRDHRREPAYRDFVRDRCFFQLASDSAPLSAIGELAEDGRVLWSKTFAPAPKEASPSQHP